MEVLSAVLKKSERLDSDTLYIEFEPENSELKDVCYHGMTLPIVGSVADTVTAYESTAAREMFAQLNKIFPGAYRLDVRYA